MTETLNIVDHPLVQHKLTLMRRKETPPALFRRLLRETALFLGAEALTDAPVEQKEISTPLESGLFPFVDCDRICFVSVLRAGNGLVDGLLDLVPDAHVGHIGLMRDHETLEAIQYYYKTPKRLAEMMVILADPMLATGNTAIAAASLLKQNGANNIKLVCLVAAPEGVERFSGVHGDIPIITAALDRRLNEKGYILPGLGDAGDRIYGTEA
ncbi:MAG: uracil phosphoribosyltransferase [Hyphococcus sp.]